MDRIALLTGLLSLLLLAAPAEAQDEHYYVLQKKVRTNFFTNAFSGNGFWVADRKIEELFAEEVAKVKQAVDRFGGQILVVNTTKLGIGAEDKLEGTASGLLIKDGKHTLYRRKGELSVLFVGTGPLPEVGLLADAEQAEAHDTVKVHLTAFDRERESRLGRRRSVRVTLDELKAIRLAPGGVKRTGYGALLRSAWGEALGDVEDDLELIEARMVLDFGGLNLSKGGFCLSIHSEEQVSSDHADLVLGRKKTGLDKWNSFLGRYQEPVELDEAHANMLRNALGYAVTQRSWEKVARIRGQTLSSQLEIDRAFTPEFLTELTSRGGASSRIPGN